ncbi:SAM hydrolase/SAM-dependent halogenase family protein [Terrilactibacillus laevilacticus]|uniref:S-adenosyl-l-methionine hydroxide adenosyltransferase family protein n=1 Tax=Terrilactibacillus laevilacticus TaxID=1380157 RepID=A0ABW5PLY3_9BACI|nr:S-adenosyl-l-methionine hydroxide adenosyltransferase family protein [Terrilactibacillus laevilacticus]
MENCLLLQTDFGLSDGAVSAMYGVSNRVSPTLHIYDLTHDIPPYNIWEASYRLLQTVNYWREGTVFVSVVDPGVGSERKSVAVKLKSGQYIITPDNGTLTHVKKYIGIAEARQINENKDRLPNSYQSHTFHGRDVYAYNGARLAANQVTFEELGSKISGSELIELPTKRAKRTGLSIEGTIDVLDIRFGSLWTNIHHELFAELDVPYGDQVEIAIKNKEREVYKNTMKFAKSFADARVGEPLLYINSLLNLAVAINQDSFSKVYNIGTGIDWSISCRKAPRIVYE